MGKLRNTTMLVRQVLATVPEARNSDNVLYIEVVRLIDQNVLRTPFAVVMQNLKLFNLPSIETVGRCRRKLQARFPELRADKEVEEFRKGLEEFFREWAGESDA